MLLIAPLLPLILTGAIASPPPSLPGGRWCAVAVTEGYSIFLLAVSLSGSCTFNVKASHKITKYLHCKSGILIDVKVHVICPPTRCDLRLERCLQRRETGLTSLRPKRRCVPRQVSFSTDVGPLAESLGVNAHIFMIREHR